MFCLVAVAYWVYGDDKRIVFLEKNLSTKLNKLEWIVEVNYKRMEERFEKLEESARINRRLWEEFEKFKKEHKANLN